LDPSRDGAGAAGAGRGLPAACGCSGLFLAMPLGTVGLLRAGCVCEAPLPARGSALTRCPARAEQQKEAEVASLTQRVSVLAGRVRELSTPSALDARAVPALRKQLWDLEASAAEQQKELERQTAAVDHLEQVAQPLPGLGLGVRGASSSHPPHRSGVMGNCCVFVFQLHQRLELEIERMKQIHQKELEDKDEELEDVRQSCQRRVGRRRAGGTMLGAAQGSPCPQFAGLHHCFPTTRPAQAPSQPRGAKSGSGSGTGGAVGDGVREPRAMQHMGMVLPVTPASRQGHRLQPARASCLVIRNRKHPFSKATKLMACKHEFQFLQNPQGV